MNDEKLEPQPAQLHLLPNLSFFALASTLLLVLFWPASEGEKGQPFLCVVGFTSSQQASIPQHRANTSFSAFVSFRRWVDDGVALAALDYSPMQTPAFLTSSLPPCVSSFSFVKIRL